MARKDQLDPSRQYRKPYKRTSLDSTARQTIKFDNEGRVALGGSTYGKVSGPVKLRLMVIRLYLNERVVVQRKPIFRML